MVFTIAMSVAWFVSVRKGKGSSAAGLLPRSEDKLPSGLQLLQMDARRSALPSAILGTASIRADSSPGSKKTSGSVRSSTSSFSSNLVYEKVDAKAGSLSQNEILYKLNTFYTLWGKTEKMPLVPGFAVMYQVFCFCLPMRKVVVCR